MAVSTTSDRSTLTTGEVADLLIAARDSTIINKGEAIKLARWDTPFANKMWQQLDPSRPLRGEYKAIAKANRSGALQAYSGRDVLTFSYYDTMIELGYGTGMVHLGNELTVQQLEEAGVSLDWSEDMTAQSAKPTGRLDPTAKAAAIHLGKEVMESFLANYNYEIAAAMWLANASDSKMFPGIDALFPVTTNNTGLIGGKSRSNPLLRHNIIAAAMNIDTIELEATKMVRACNDNNAGDGSRINLTVAGDSVFNILSDLYLGTSTRVGKINRQMASDKAKEMAAKWGIGIPEESFYVPGVGLIVRDPTFNDLDRRDPSASVPWRRRWYFFNTDTIQFYGPRHGHLICHPIPHNQRILRQSLEGKYGWVVKKPNANGVLYVGSD